MEMRDTATKCLVTVGLAALALAVLAAGGCQSGGGNEIQVAVTDQGFQPSEIKVKKGQDVTLAITRQTDMTCATDVVVADRGIRQVLPLKETVRVALGKVESDTLRFACGMDMIAGMVVTE